MRIFITIITALGICYFGNAQTGSLHGKLISEKYPVAFGSVFIPLINLGTLADSAGNFTIDNLPVGEYKFVVTTIEYDRLEGFVEIRNSDTSFIKIELTKSGNSLNPIVVTGTRTPKRKTNSPVIVNLINSKKLDQVVANCLSDGLKYQPGLRVETNCQTCNYTQLRMNGLPGGYSQILINSRPIFSPLMGLYGMEQISANMIERIEVVRGGVSALYGSSAIGGTVNIITKIPNENSYNLSNTFQNIKGQTSENILTGNSTLISENKKSGISFFVSNRRRNHYDANGDNFSELPKLVNNNFGTNLFLIPNKNQKLELYLSSIYEYRFGGENIQNAPHLAKQSEERTHNILMGSADYSISFNDNKNLLSIYYGGQETKRNHYTGILPDDSLDIRNFIANPPYGNSKVLTHQGGLQLNKKIKKFLGSSSEIILGTEYIVDQVFDEINSYNYKIDQKTKNFGTFIQLDNEITKKLNFLSGIRMDKHNLIGHTIFSPRLSFLYKPKQSVQLRLGWGTGFRAPQAFDTDLHIAFAGGGVSRIVLSKDLQEEKSNSFTGSINFDKASTHFIAGFTLEGFYTKLKNAFIITPLESDRFGQLFEKRNGNTATVKGISLETRANFDYVVQIEAGYTLQTSEYKIPVQNIKGQPSKKEFLRTPKNYGYTTITYNPIKNLNINANVVYTGKMLLAHFAGEGTGQSADEYYTSNSFTDIGLKISYNLNFNKIKTGIEVFTGVKNLLDSYQKVFDKGKNRDSNFIYGPNLPRSIFIGIKLKSM